MTELPWLRLIAGAFAGIVVMSVLTAGGMAAMQHALGNDAIFLPGSYGYAPPLVLWSIALTTAAALLGGFICALAAGTRRAADFLAGIVLILGLSGAVSSILRPDPGPRPPDVPAAQAARNARPPAWLALSLPALSAAAIAGGGRARRTAR